MSKITCRLARAEAADGAFPVLLNGQRVTLPAVRCSCTASNGDHAFEYVLDEGEMAYPLWAPNGQTIQINYPPAPKGQPGGGGQAIEQALKKEGHVDVYGIYFDFASDKLRPESAPVLAEIATTLKNNPTWKLRVNGHTDNIGGDAYNLDLSNRRAAAVKQALVAQYQIDPARLDPQGFGATQPKESNDTLEGRARNRRVELVRE
jgi:outer membrane protein OmpA-like peptidoglycan-associated protein